MRHENKSGVDRSQVWRRLALCGVAMMISMACWSGCSAPSRAPITIAAVSSESKVADKEFNLSRIEHWAREAADAGADVVLFPELAVTAWFQSREYRETAEPLDGPAVQRLIRLAGELDVILAVGMAEAAGDKVHITHVIVDGDGIIGTHRKSALAGGKTGEGRVFDVGNDANVFDIKGWRLGIAICFETVHPETCAALKSKGVEIVLAPYANGTDPAEMIERRHSRRWVWHRVDENRVWFVACDATPHRKGGGLLPGAAYAINPDGELVACTDPDTDGEQMIVVTIQGQSAKLRR